MAKNRGYWKITFSTEPEEHDLEYIAQLVAQGYTSGEICENEDTEEEETEEE